MSYSALAIFGHSSSYVHIDHHGLGAYGGYDGGYGGHEDYHVCCFVLHLKSIFEKKKSEHWYWHFCHKIYWECFSILI